MNYNYPLYAPYWKVDAFKKSWYSTLSSLFKMINVKDQGDGSFVIEWDENDPEESILNDWSKEDFTNFLRYCAQRENSEEFGEESKETYYNSESEGKENYYTNQDPYIQAINKEIVRIEGDELSED
jgi:hypothetical protein